MDEAGTPFCVTVDFDTLEDDTVTVLVHLCERARMRACMRVYTDR